MKNFFSTLLIAFAAHAAFAQSPQAFKYQGVARNSSGIELANTALTVRATIHDITPTGTIVYQETQAVTTNSFGLFSINLGSGSVTSGTFSAVNWGGNAKYLQQEIDFGSGFQNMGTSQLLSVPYALYAPGTIPDGTAAGNTIYWNGSSWVTNSSNIFNNGGNVGINTTTPSHTFEVQGNTYSSAGFVTSNTQNYGFSTPKTYTMSVSPIAFHSTGGSLTMVRNLSGAGTNVSTYGGTYTNNAVLYAPINLPDGATITKVTGYIADTDASYASQVAVVGVNMTTGIQSLYAVTPSSSASAVTPYSYSFSHVVNNSVNAYGVRFETYENNGNLILSGIVIEYTVNKVD
jgi:hypothetical protein